MHFIKLRTENDLILVNPDSVTKMKGGIEGNTTTITLVDGDVYRVNCNIKCFVENLHCKESGRRNSILDWSANRIIE